MTDMMLKRDITRNLPWLIILVVLCLWFRFDIYYNSASSLENATILKGILVYSTDNFTYNFDKFATELPAYFTGLVSSIGGLAGNRLFSVFLSIVTLFIFYKFSYHLLEDKFGALIAVLLFYLQGPFIFISKYASTDLVTMTFFTSFLWISILLLKDCSSDNNRVIYLSILSAVLFIIAVMSNLLLILFLPIAFYFYLSLHPLSGKFFSGITIILLVLIYLLFNNAMKLQLMEIFYWPIVDEQNVFLSKLFVRVAEYLAIPLMLFYAAYQMIWKTHFKPKMIAAFLSLSLVIPLYLILYQDIFNIFRLISYSYLFILPLSGLILSKFLNMNKSYKYATIFTFFFILGLSYMQVSKLENSFPNTQNALKICKDNIDKNSIVYSEDPCFFAVNFYPLLKLSNILNFTNNNLYHNDNLKSRTNISNHIVNGGIDFLMLNTINHFEYTEVLKNEYITGIYKNIYSEDFEINTSMYSENSGTLDIYKLKSSVNFKKGQMAIKSKPY